MIFDFLGQETIQDELYEQLDSPLNTSRIFGEAALVVLNAWPIWSQGALVPNLVRGVPCSPSQSESVSLIATISLTETGLVSFTG